MYATLRCMCGELCRSFSLFRYLGNLVPPFNFIIASILEKNMRVTRFTSSSTPFPKEGRLPPDRPPISPPNFCRRKKPFHYPSWTRLVSVIRHPWQMPSISSQKVMHLVLSLSLFGTHLRASLHESKIWRRSWKARMSRCQTIISIDQH